jgi:hypothetical protein
MAASAFNVQPQVAQAHAVIGAIEKQAADRLKRKIEIFK